MPIETLIALRDQALLLSDHLKADIQNASTRVEHIRLTQHASEAERLVSTMNWLIQTNEPPTASAATDTATFLPTHF